MTNSFTQASDLAFSFSGFSRLLAALLWRMGMLAIVAVLMFPELVLAQTPAVYSLYVPKTWKLGAEPLPLRIQIDAGRVTQPTVTVNWQLDDSTPQRRTLNRTDLGQPSDPDPALTELGSNLNITSTGQHTFRLWFSDEDGAVTLGDTLAVSILALEHDFERRILLEEFTGTWCGWCPSGMEVVYDLAEAYPGRIVPVLIHNRDPMAFEEGDLLTSLANLSGFPSAQIDRTTFPGIVVAPAIFRDIWAAATEAQLRAASRASLAAEVAYNDTTREITVDLSSTFLTDFTGMPRFGLHLLEDSMSFSGAGWDQANYTNTHAGSRWFGQGNPIRNFVHRHVLRAIPGGVRGISGVIPQEVEKGQTFTHRITFARPRGTRLRQLSVVAYIYNESGSNKLKEIFQTVEVPVVERTGVSRNPQATTIFEAALMPNPARHQAELHFRLQTGQAARWTLFDVQGRELRQVDLGTLPAGPHRLPLDVSELPAGLYFVALTAGTHTHIERLLVD